MSREIKFRALVRYTGNENNEYHWEYYHPLDDPTWDNPLVADIVAKDLQYTGLTDKHGHEIYDGDIIEAVLPAWEDSGVLNETVVHEFTEKRVIGEVRIRPVGGTGMIARIVDPIDTVNPGYGERILGVSPGNFIRIQQEKDKIIGNRHEHPELLED